MRFMLFKSALCVLAAFTIVGALPTQEPKPEINDTIILNYALTLEHLENAFYIEALAKFDDKAFQDAGFAPLIRSRFKQIADHEKQHVEFLSKALGDLATQPCTYHFPYTDVKSFIALSQVLEGVGTSAYTGAAQFIVNKKFLTVAASILATEARHASWIASAANNFPPFNSAFEVPLTLNEVFTLAVPFITSCPSTNPKLPLRAFPPLTLNSAQPGKDVVVEHKAPDKPTHVAFFSGLDKIFIPIQDGKVLIPNDLQGQLYAVATTSATEATDDTIVAGPAVLLFDKDSNGNPL